MKTLFRIARNISLISLASASITSSADTLMQVYELAKTNSPEYRAAYASLQSDMQNGAIGRSALLPNVRLSAQSRYSDPLGPTAIGAAAQGSDTTSSYSASISQTLFDLSDWYSYRSGNLSVDRALLSWEQEEQDLITNSVSAYLNVLRAMDTLESVLAEKAAIESQLEQTQQRFDVGLVAITDVLEAQASYDDIISQELDAQGNLAIAYEALTVLTGQSHLSIAPLMDNYPVVAPTPAESTDWVELSMANSQTLDLARISVESAELSKKDSWTSYYPTVEATASYGGNLEGINDADRAAGFYDEGGSFVVTLEVPIITYTGGSTWARRVQATHNLTEAEELFANTERNLRQSIRVSHTQVMVSISQVQARLQSIRSAEAALEATRAGYEVGTRNLVDVLLAERTLYSATRNYLNTRYDYIEGVLSLKSSAGILTVEDLQELDRWMDANNQVLRGQYLP